MVKALQGSARKGANIDARDAHSVTAGDSDASQMSSHRGNAQNSRGRAPVVHYNCGAVPARRHYLPADQRELCVGAYEDHVIPQRWERIVAGGVA